MIPSLTSIYIWQRAGKGNLIFFVASEPNEKMLCFMTFFILKNPSHNKLCRDKVTRGKGKTFDF